MISIVKQCEKELKYFPLAVREDLADALALLNEGVNLSMHFKKNRNKRRKKILN